MADLTPNNREEYWLKGMVDGQTTLEPNERREYWYKEIVDAIGSGGGGGTGGGVLVATMDLDTGALDKTWQEILSAAFCVIVLDYGTDGKDYLSITHIISDESGKVIEANTGNTTKPKMTFIASSANDYPVAQG
jgi:hypothetical protein